MKDNWMMTKYQVTCTQRCTGCWGEGKRIKQEATDHTARIYGKKDCKKCKGTGIMDNGKVDLVAALQDIHQSLQMPGQAPLEKKSPFAALWDREEAKR